MKTKKLLFIFFSLVSVSIHGQGQVDLTAHRKQLSTINYLAGKWKGTASIQQPGGKTLTLHQSETITWELDSLLMRIEGVGTDPETKKKSFHAFAIISYNPMTQQLGLRSYTHEGRQTDAYFNPISVNQFEWGFDLPANRGKVRYTIVISETDKTWTEKGEFSPDGTRWMPFITMNLVKESSF